MGGPIESLRGMFVRPAGVRPPCEPEELPANVIQLRPGGAVKERSQAPPAPRGPELSTSRIGAAAPLVVVAGLGGLPEHWLAMAIAGVLRDRAGARSAFVVDPGFVHESQVQSRLRLGAGGILLPFAVKRNGSRLMTIGAQAAESHDGFLRAIGPMVWSLGGADEHREVLCEQASRADMLVLARPGEVDAAYCAIVADELGSECDVRAVRRVLCAPAHQAGTEPAVGETVVPAANLDRWRIERGLGCAGAVARAVEDLVESL